LLAIHYRPGYQGDRIAWSVQFTRDDVYNAYESIGGRDADVGGSPNLFEANGRPLVGVGDKGASYRAFDRRTGAQVWRANLDIGSFPGFGGVMTTGAVQGDTVYIASNHNDLNALDLKSSTITATVYALDTATGRQRWSVPVTSGDVFGALTIANGLLYYSAIDGTIYARELASGKLAWSTKLDGSIGSAVSIVDGRLYVSSGFGLLGTGQSDQPGVVSSFALGDGPYTVWKPAPEVRKPMTGSECLMAIAQSSAWTINTPPSAECMSCLCQCDATASGYCDACWLLAPCAITNCSTVEPGDAMRTCLGDKCTAKLMPNFVFNSAVETAPCAIKCRRPCGL
jgi:outer membrane protein assembly factor BamB